MYCDCCHRKLKVYGSSKKGSYKHKEGYIAYTTLGMKNLCWECKTFYQINDRLPNKK